MSNPTRGARKNEPTFSAPKIDNSASSPIMSYENLNGQTFPQQTNPIRSATSGEEVKPRMVGMQTSFENTIPNTVRSASKNK